jgi:hypothetical protein
MYSVDRDDHNNRRDEWIDRARKRFTTHRGEKPVRKAGQLRALWREVQNAMDDGQSLETIRGWLEEEGIILTSGTLRSYIWRVRQKQRTEAERRFLAAAIAAPAVTPSATQLSLGKMPEEVLVATEPAKPAAPSDPLAQAMEALSKERFDIRKIHGDGDPRGRNLL